MNDKLNQVLQTWGFVKVLGEDKLVKTQENSEWISKHSENYKKFTEVLKNLSAEGFRKEAALLSHAMLDVWCQDRTIADKEQLKEWRQAVDSKSYKDVGLIKQLRELKANYFDEERGLYHYSMCTIYRSIDMHGFAPCNCGLMSSLYGVSFSLAEKIHTNFWEEKVKDDVIWEPAPPGTPARYVKPKPISEEEYKELLSAFKLKEWTAEEIKMIEDEDDQEWDVVKTIFGEKFAKKNKIIVDKQREGKKRKVNL